MGIFITNILLIVLIAVVSTLGERVLRQMGERKAIEQQGRRVSRRRVMPDDDSDE